MNELGTWHKIANPSASLGAISAGLGIRIIALIATLSGASSLSASMIGDPVMSTLHISSGGWDGSGAAIVGPGIEFSRTFGSFAHLTLDIAAASFTLTYIKDQPSNGFNAGLNGFEFTDLSQTFAGVSLVPGNTFPNGTFTSTSVSFHNIHIFMNQPIIPDGATWTATWNVNSSSATVPEPSTFALLFLGLAALPLPARLKRKQGRP